MQQGITFEVAGSDGERRDRAWPLDLVPRVLTAAEWTTIKRGLAQRIRALNAFVDDVYHAHEIVRAGIVPWSLIVSRPSFARPVHGVRAPGGVYCHVSGCDLVRDGSGRWRVLEDNVRTPSGISYVLENRVAMTRLMPELFAGPPRAPGRRLPVAAARRAALGRAGRRGTATSSCLDARIDELGVLRARLPGAADGGRARRGLRPRRARRGLLHAHHRRAAAGAHDLPPARRRRSSTRSSSGSDSLLGVPGLVRAYRAGTVAIANAIGTGVADDKAIYHYVPEMIRFYLARSRSWKTSRRIC